MWGEDRAFLHVLFETTTINGTRIKWVIWSTQILGNCESLKVSLMNALIVGRDVCCFILQLGRLSLHVSENELLQSFYIVLPLVQMFSHTQVPAVEVTTTVVVGKQRLTLLRGHLLLQARFSCKFKSSESEVFWLKGNMRKPTTLKWLSGVGLLVFARLKWGYTHSWILFAY